MRRLCRHDRGCRRSAIGRRWSFPASATAWNDRSAPWRRIASWACGSRCTRSPCCRLCGARAQPDCQRVSDGRGRTTCCRRRPHIAGGRSAYGSGRNRACPTCAGAHQPRRVGVVFAQVAAVRIEIGMIEHDQVEMVEKLVAGQEIERQGHEFGVAGGAHVVDLLALELLRADDLDVGDLLRVVGDIHRVEVGARRSVTRLATDARLAPHGLVGVGGQIVVRAELADVAIEAGGVESEHAVGPGEGLVAAVGEVPHAAGRRVVPGLLVDVVGQRQDLQSPALQGGEKVVDVLASHHLLHGIRLFAVGTALANPPSVVVDLRPIAVLADRGFAGLGHEGLAAKRGRVGLHGQPVERRRPELVEVFVAIAADLRADELPRGGGNVPGRTWWGFRRLDGAAAACDLGRNFDGPTLAAEGKSNHCGDRHAYHDQTKGHIIPVLRQFESSRRPRRRQSLLLGSSDRAFRRVSVSPVRQTAASRPAPQSVLPFFPLFPRFAPATTGG